MEIQVSTVGVGYTAADVVSESSLKADAAVSDVRALSLLIAGRLEHFTSRVPEVPSSAAEEMILAVEETCNVVFGLAGAALEAAGHSLTQNLSKSCRVLRAGQIPQTDYNARGLENIAAAVEEMIRGVDQAKVASD